MAEQTRNLYRVLIVSDEMNIRGVLEELLAGPGRSVEVRDTAQAALEFLEHNPVDVAFLVPGARGMPGSKLAEQIKQSRPQARVLVCDGLADENRAPGARITRLPRTADRQVAFGDALQLADSYKTE